MILWKIRVVMPKSSAMSVLLALIVTIRAEGQLDSTWTVTVNGQTVQVNPDGSFYIPNIAAADVFPVDFVSDDPLLVVGVRTVDGVAEYAVSSQLQITQSLCINPPCQLPTTVIEVNDFMFTPFPPPFPESISFGEDIPDVLEVGQSIDITTWGVVVGESEPVDITSSCLLTSYRISNRSILMIEEIGECEPMQPQPTVRVTAGAPGVVFVTATNLGATAVKRFVVVSELNTTSIEGLIRLDDGTPVSGALVTTVPDFRAFATTNSNGYFSIDPVLTSCETGTVFRVHARTAYGEAESLPITLRGDGVTDAGIIVVATPLPGACCEPDGECSGTQTNPVTPQECEAANGLFQPGEYCSVGNQSCPPGACITATQPCYVVNLNGTGCQNLDCCSEICVIDNFCCVAAWDQTCVGLAYDICGLSSLDLFVNALEIPCGAIDEHFENWIASTSPADPPFTCFGSPPGEQGIGTVWYYFTAASSSALLSVCDSAASDTILAVYSGGCGDLTELACNDNGTGCTLGSGLSELCVTDLEVDHTYYVQVASASEMDRGDFYLQINCPCPP